MTLRGRLLVATLVGILSSTSAWAADPADATASTRILGACDVVFMVTSTLRDFPGSAHCLPFEAAVSRDAAGGRVIRNVEVEVPVAGMDTRNKSRDGDMRKMFLSDKYPRIRGTAQDVDVERLREEARKDPDGKAALDLLLRIRDAERKIRTTVSNLKESGDRVTFDLEFPVLLGEFDIKAPTVFGIIRVGDKVPVKVNFTLTVPGSPSGATSQGSELKSTGGGSQ